MASRTSKLLVGVVSFGLLAGSVTNAFAIRNRYNLEEARELGYFTLQVLGAGYDEGNALPRYRPYPPAGFGRPPLTVPRYVPPGAYPY